MSHPQVPCLIKELLEKHFDSAEAIQKFLKSPATISHSTTSPQADGQSHAPKMEDLAVDWMTKSEGGLQRVTAFLPFKQGVPAAGTEGGHESSYSPPFSVSDISSAICKKMAASFAARPQPLYPQSQQQQQQPPPGTNHTDTTPNLHQAHVGGDSWGGTGGVKVTLFEQDVTSSSAQQILDEFIQQLQPHKEAGGGKEQQGGR